MASEPLARVTAIPDTTRPESSSGEPSTRIALQRGYEGTGGGEALNLLWIDRTSGKSIQVGVSRGKDEVKVDLAPGAYRLDGDVIDGSRRWRLAPRHVIIPEGRVMLPVHVGGPTAVYYRIGESLIPAQLGTDELFLFRTGSPADPDAAAQVVGRLRDALDRPDLMVGLMGEKAPTLDQLARSDVWRLFIDPESITLDQWRRLQKQLGAGSSLATSMGRSSAGMMLFQRAEYVVRVNAGREERLLECMNEAGAKRLRYLTRDRDLILLQFERIGDVARHEQIVRAWISNELIEKGELDLLFMGTDEHGPGATTWPKDEFYEHQRQGNHGAQAIPQAWGTLGMETLLSSQGTPEVPLHVGSVDLGVQLSDREVDCLAIGRSTPVVEPQECFDAGTGMRCDLGGHHMSTLYSGSSSPDMHGMAIFGVISGCADNAQLPGYKGQAVGIAPGVRHIAVKTAIPVSSVGLGNAWLWMAGLDIECAGEGGPACAWEKSPHRASVVNVSLAMPVETTAGLPMYWQKVLTRLNDPVESGPGTLIVIAAGNYNQKLDVNNALMDPRILTVANCEKVPSGTRRFAHECTGSSYGPALSLCALGAGSITLDAWCAPQAGTAIRQPCRVGGTSAAAATITGIAALVLLAKPDLTAAQLHCVLRSTASRQLKSTSWLPPAPCSTSWQRSLDCGFQGDRSPCYGYGRADADAAVTAVLSGASTALDACLQAPK